MKKRAFSARGSWPVALAAVLVLMGCGRTSDPAPQVHRMGDKVQVGSLIYTVLEAHWKSQLGDPPDQRVPKHRFLVLRLVVTNSGGRAASIPQLALEDIHGNSFHEENNGGGVPQWLGIIRKVDPAGTDEGRILFDVPPASYRLRLNEDPDFAEGTERSALVAIPLQIETDAPLPPPK